MSMGSGFARVFSSAASVLFLGCLVMAARHRRELWWIAAAFLLGEIAAALGSLHGLAYAVYLVGAGFSPAPVLLGVTLADILTLSVFALLLWKLRTWFPALAATALRISAAVLLVTGLAWFCLQLR
jgi:hypothetical protein